MTDIGEIKERYTPEMALIILICRVYFGTALPTDIDAYLENTKVDWVFLERIITSHQIHPIIYKVLSVHSGGVEAVFLAALRSYCRSIAAGNLQKLSELTIAYKAMREAGAQAIPYKGVILSNLLFGDYITRETADIDFLLKSTSFTRAAAALSALGFTPRYYNPDFERQFLKTSHELSFSKETTSGPIKIELHWAATNHMMKVPLGNDDIMGELQSIQLMGSDVEILTLQHHLLVLLVHHGVNDVWRVLRHGLDIALFVHRLNEQIDWQALHAATVKYKICHTTQVGLQINNYLFGTAIPVPFATKGAPPMQILDNILTFPALPKQKLDWNNLRQQLFLRDSAADKLRLLGAYIYTGIAPNVRDMEAVPLAKPLYPLYYLIKPFRLLFRKK
jgi:hypothetical protein